MVVSSRRDTSCGLDVSRQLRYLVAEVDTEQLLVGYVVTLLHHTAEGHCDSSALQCPQQGV